MKRKKIFGKNMTFLVVGILIVLSFIKGEKQIWYLIGVFAIWGIWTLGAVLLANWSYIKEKFNKKNFTKSGKKKNSIFNDTEDENGASLLRHVNFRISENLKSVYPTITWEWCLEKPEQFAIEGGTGRIRLFGITDFNYADVTLDEFAQLDFNLIKIMSFAELTKTDKSENTPPRDNTQVTPETWYNIQGKKILESCIADLNSRGYSSLIIKENGDICIKQEDKEVIKNKFNNLPGKNTWQGLIKIIENDGLGAAVTGNTIKVSW